MGHSIPSDTPGEIVALIAYDGSDYHVITLDGDNGPVLLLGWDGSSWQQIKTNAQGQVEIEVKGAA